MSAARMRRERPESGFALLLVFAMSAALAIMLYRQLPRAAFEAQRSKEELLIERGEQYTRAIQLYVSQWKRYPATIEDLEKSNNKRYLRRRYKDPMTGTDEWRLIHVDGNGMLTDSKIQKNTEKKPNQNTFVTEFASIGSAPASGSSAPNLAQRRRPSDGPQPDMPSAFGNGSQANQFGQFSYPATPFQPVAGPQPTTGQQQPLGQQQLPPGLQLPQGQQQPQGPQPQVPNPQIQINPLAPFDPQKPITPQQAYPNGMPAFPGALPGQVAPGSPPVPGQIPGQVQPNYGQQIQQQPTFPIMPATQAGRPGGPATNAGIDAVMKSLTTPQPQMAGVAGVPGLQIGGGIAGVATKYESGSIKLYNERQKYEEWEFVYDIKKDKRLAAQMGSMQPNMGNNPNPGSNPNLGGNPNSGIPNPNVNSNTGFNQNQNQNQGFQNNQQIPFPIMNQPPGSPAPRPGPGQR